MLCKKADCVNCFGCVNICPVHSIDYWENEQRFYEFSIDEQNCVDCRQCEKVCPGITLYENREEAEIYAAYSKDADIRKTSSSGGIFYQLAKYIIEAGGVVCGAAFDRTFHLKHQIVDSIESLYPLMGSKYVQSEIGKDTFQQLKSYLEQGRKVLFAGTPCQADACGRVLGKDKENLLICDFICHGVAAPKVFKEYLEYLEQQYKAPVESFSFRNKLTGWKKFSFKAVFKNGRTHQKTYGTDPYSIGFQKAYFLRESCYHCKYASAIRYSDITIGDFWGYQSKENEFKDTDEGISVIFCNSLKGKAALNQIKNELEIIPKTMDEARAENICLNHCFSKPSDYDEFWKYYKDNGFEAAAEKYLSVDGKVYVDKYDDNEAKKRTGKKIVVIPSDSVGSKGDEAMLRGILNVFRGTEIQLLSPRNELWKGWIVDRAGEFAEEYVPLEKLKERITEPVHLIIVGADIMDGLYGSENALYRLDAAEKVIDLGGTVEVFSCSFRSIVPNEIVQKIVNIGEGLFFHLRDKQSLENFERLTGRRAEFFPDMAFLCETIETERSKAVVHHIQEKRCEGAVVCGVNFNEHSCKGFFEVLTDECRKEYIRQVVDSIYEEYPEAVIVLIPHDTKVFQGHVSDEQYALWAEEYITENRKKDVIRLNAYLWEAELLSILESIDFLVSGRMHLTIAGLRKRVLPIGYMGHNSQTSFSNSEKFRGIYQQRLGSADFLAENSTELRRLLQMFREEGAVLRERLEKNNVIYNEETLHYVQEFREKNGLYKEFEMNLRSKSVKNETEVQLYIAQKELEFKKLTEKLWEFDSYKAAYEKMKAESEYLRQDYDAVKKNYDALENSKWVRILRFLQKGENWLRRRKG